MFITQDKMDNFLYKDTKNANPGIPALEDKGVDKLPVWPEAVKDLWAGMFKQTPEFDLNANGALAQAMKDVMETKEWGNLRNHTRLDEVGSAIGTVTFGNNFYDNLPPEVFEIQKAQDEQKVIEEAMQQNQEENQALEQKKQELEQQKQKATEEQQAQIQQQQGQIAQQQAQIQQQQQGLQQQLGGKQGQVQKLLKGFNGDVSQVIRQAGRKAAEKANTETSELKSFIQAWGDTAGTGKVPTLKEQMTLAQKLQKDKKFRKVVELVGRMKRMAESIQAKKVTRVPEEIVDVETGRDLTSVLPSQFSLLNNPLTKLEFYRQYEERSLIQYQKRGTEKAGKGPIVVMVDESGSMDGDRILWAKAVGLALAHLAKKQKRTIVLGGFSSSGQIWTEKFEKGQIPEKALDKYLKQFYNGGTDYNLALKRCMKEVKEIKQEKADVVFISDGECYLDTNNKKEFLKLKKEMGFRVFGIGIGVAADSFEDFCDQSYSIENLDTESDVVLEGVFGI